MSDRCGHGCGAATRLTFGDSRISILRMKRLRCVECGMEGSPSESWLWYGKEVELPAGRRGLRRDQQLWLCPDCAADLGSDEECEAFFARLTAGEKNK